MSLVVVAPAFEPDLKWRLSDGATRFPAAILDEHFNARVEAGERFGRGDELRASIRRTQWRDDTGLHSEIEVLRVIEHVPSVSGEAEEQRLI